MSLAMTKTERDEFLLARETGVMIAIGGGAAFAVPVWYDYEPGGTIGFVCNEGSRRLAAIDAPGAEVGLTVHHEANRMPAFVTAFGPVVRNHPLDGADLARLLPTMVRALGGEQVVQRYVASGGDRWVRGLDTSSPATPRRIEMAPTRWNSCDYSKAADRLQQIFNG
jgi:hypothetical protein